MKKAIKRLAGIALMACLAILPACSSKESEATPGKAKVASEEKAGQLPNYRYVDLDTILSKYNLAIDYNEEMLRMQTNLENKGKSHESKLQSQAAAMQRKMQNNGYLSEESYKQDQQILNNMQVNAQQDMAKLQNNMETAAMAAQKAINDSIEAFIKDYNKKRGYDAILFKAATLYINPALDITDEVVEGLNKKYNKKEK